MSDALTGLSIRFASREDVPVLLTLIRELAEFEKLLDQVTADEAALTEGLFGSRPWAEAILPELEGDPEASVFFFHISPLLRRPGRLFRKTFFLRPHARGNGVRRLLSSYS